jgi:pyruvate/2-oxoglutarate dehydrogenase complex dihydrolipoamide acyltransferase (E2) component
LEVFTDKLVAHIPSSYKGEIKKVYFNVDDVIQVGSTILDIDVPNEVGSSSGVSKEKSVEKSPVSAGKSAAAPAPSGAPSRPSG